MKNDPAGVNLAKLAKAAPLWSGSADGSDSEIDDSSASKTDEEVIAEAAALGLLAYAQRKKELAKNLNITVAELDKIVAKERRDADERKERRAALRALEHRALG